MSALNPGLVASFTAAVLVNLALPWVVAVLLARRYGARWRWWFAGAGVFLVFQVLTRIPVMVVVQSLPPVRQVLERPLYGWTFLGLAALTAGLFEEGGRWLAFRYLVRPGERHWTTGVMLGAGHGGLEVLGVGLLQLAALVNYLVLTLWPPEMLAAFGAPVDQARAAFASLQGWEPLLGAWERLAALAIQIALSVLVLQAFLRGARWWWLALLVHTAVDFTSVGLLKLTAQPWGQPVAMLATEGLVTLYAVLALGYVRHARQPAAPEGDHPPG